MENKNIDEAVNKVNEMVNNGVLFSALAYIPFLWLLGLLIAPAKDSSFVKGHVNNGIILTIIGAIAFVIGFIPVIGAIVGWVVGAVCIVAMIVGIYKSIMKQAFLFPVIGDSIKIIK